MLNKNFLQDSKTPLTQNIARPNNSNDLAIYKIVAEAKKNGKNIKYSELDSKLKTHKHTDKFWTGSKLFHGILHHIQWLHIFQKMVIIIFIQIQNKIDQLLWGGS